MKPIGPIDHVPISTLYERVRRHGGNTQPPEFVYHGALSRQARFLYGDDVKLCTCCKHHMPPKSKALEPPPEAETQQPAELPKPKVPDFAALVKRYLAIWETYKAEQR